MKRKHTIKFSSENKLSQRINSLLGVWVGISFSGLLIWNGIVGMPSQMSSCTVPYPGAEVSISLSVGDTLCIPPGEIFKGRIEDFPESAHIKVYKNAIFHPIGFSDAKGSIENHGLIIMENIEDPDGLNIDNNGKIEVMKAPGAQSNLQIFNRLDANLKFLSNISEISAKFDLVNYGDVYVEGDFRLGRKCKIENNGKIVFQGEFVINGQVSNFGIIQVL